MSVYSMAKMHFNPGDVVRLVLRGQHTGVYRNVPAEVCINNVCVDGLYHGDVVLERKVMDANIAITDAKDRIWRAAKLIVLDDGRRIEKFILERPR